MNIYLTLDYELYMGAKSGTVKNCLIDPMNKLLGITRDLGVGFTVFVDAAYLYRLSELKGQSVMLQSDYDTICENLRELVLAGNSVQLHIHPQWYFSTISDGEWEINQNCYKLSDIPSDQLLSFFSKSKHLLEEITGTEVKAFRAGGYSLQSLDNYVAFLSQNSITIDSSVASGQCYKSKYQWYDYSNVIGGIVYKFSSDVVMEDITGKMTEYPISSMQISTIKYILYRMYLKWFKSVGKAYGDGLPVPSSQRLKLLETKTMNCSFDYIMAPMLRYIFKRLQKSGCADAVLIGHPKNQSDESIEELRRFIISIKDTVSFKLIG